MPSYYTKSEYSCKCGCGFDTLYWRTLDAANALRDHLGVPITVSSGCRCVDHNRAVGGARASYHLPRNIDGVWQGMALDLVVDDSRYCLDWLTNKYPDISCISYPDFIHIDFRPVQYIGYRHE